MNLSKYLTTETIKMKLEGNSPEEILREMVEVLCEAGKVGSNCIDDAVKALIRREKMMSTGLQNGVAIPHAKVSGVKDLVGALAFKPEGIDFGAMDGKPSTIFVMTLSPNDRPVPHVPFLAEVAKILQNTETCERLLSAHNAHEVVDVLFN